SVAHLGNLREHHCRTCSNEQIRRKTKGRIGRDTGEGIAAAALHACGARFASACIQPREMFCGGPHDGSDHLLKTDMRLVLQTHQIEAEIPAACHARGHSSGWEQALRLKLLATQADNHQPATEVRIEADVAQRSDRDVSIGRVDSDTAAINVFKADRVVDIRKPRQELGSDPLHRVVDNAGDTLHRRGDGQHVACTYGPGRVAITLECVAFKCWLVPFRARCNGYAMKRRSCGYRKQCFMHPAAGLQRLVGIADDDVVAPYRRAFGNIDEGDLMALGHMFAKLETTRKPRSAGEPKISTIATLSALSTRI